MLEKRDGMYSTANLNCIIKGRKWQIFFIIDEMLLFRQDNLHRHAKFDTIIWIQAAILPEADLEVVNRMEAA